MPFGFYWRARGGQVLGMGQIVKLSFEFKPPGAWPLWVKLSFDFDMGQIVKLLDIGQIVICFLLPAFFFLRGNSLGARRQNIGQIVKLSRENNRWLITLAAVAIYKYTNP